MHEPTPALEQTLAGRTIAIPETRELDVFAALLERRGASVVRCPLVSILDAPDPGPTLEFVRWCVAGACDDLILLTGEGLRRIMSCIDRHAPDLRVPFIERLASVRKIVRGPKPAKALRELGLRADMEAVAPTTDGVIETLRSHALTGRRVGVQLYGSEPNLKLVDFLESRGAVVRTVAPYIYADKAADVLVLETLTRMREGGIDVFAFTSKSQVDRLLTLAPRDLLNDAMAHTRVAAVGPVVRDALTHEGFRVDFMPEDAFFMKPLVRSLEQELGPRQ